MIKKFAQEVDADQRKLDVFVEQNTALDRIKKMFDEPWNELINFYS